MLKIIEKIKRKFFRNTNTCLFCGSNDLHYKPIDNRLKYKIIECNRCNALRFIDLIDTKDI